LLIGSLVLGVGATATVAAWTDDEFASGQISAGTFSLVSRSSEAATFVAHDTSATAAVLPLAATNLYPGESRAAFIQIKTSGNVPGSVNLTAVTANATGTANLALQTALTVRIVPTSAVGDTPPTCTTATTGGTTGPITSVLALTAMPLQANGANTVTYCVIVTLPTNAASAAQGGIVTPIWTFTGTTN
jgi:predicted ribosomally synthesized peptide with SipW-like signal peptide